jgi:acyl carrier protein
MTTDINSDLVLHLLVEHEIFEPSLDLTADSDLFALGLDSMALMQLMLQIEASLDVTIDPAEVRREHFATATALTAFLQHKTLSR